MLWYVRCRHRRRDEGKAMSRLSYLAARLDKIDPLSDEPIGAIVHEAAALLREAELLLRECVGVMDTEGFDGEVKRIRALIG